MTIVLKKFAALQTSTLHKAEQRLLCAAGTLAVRVVAKIPRQSWCGAVSSKILAEETAIVVAKDNPLRH